MSIKKFTKGLLLLSIVIFSEVLMAQAKSEYFAAVESGDKYYSAGDYINAKTSYQYATRLKPDEEYPREKLDKTMIKLRETMALVEQYTIVITDADKYFKDKEYENAIVKYKEASSIIPSEGYPQQKIEEIKGAKEQVKKNRYLYDDAIYRADKFVKYRKFEQAIESYRAALELFPTEPYPREKIAELEEQLSILVASSNEYEAIVKNADRLSSFKYYENARAEYQKASDIRPEEEYPINMMNEMDKLLVKKNEFDLLVADADNHYMNKELDEAKNKYQEALKIYPSESYPQDMIEKINSGLKKQLGKNELYSRSVANGDKFLAADDLTNALQEYQNAVDLKSNESYPQQKIDEINRILDEQDQEERVYTFAISAGDQYISAGSYMAAKKEFEKALKIKPNADYPNERMALVNEALKEQEATSASYNIAIEKASAFLEEEKYDDAKLEYEKALFVIPGDKYAKDQVALMVKLKKQKEVNAAEYPKVVAQADKLLEKKDLAGARVRYMDAQNLDKSQTYPAEKIAEIDKILIEQQKINDEYTRVIATADIFYNKKEYELARQNYEKAAKLKPTASHPQERLGKIAGLSVAGVALSQGDEYTDAIKEADKHFGLMEYEDAKRAYIKASNLRPKEQYPKDKIVEIDNLVYSQDANIAEYNKQIAAADRMMESGDYDKAKERYLLASSIFPREQYPKDKLAEIESAILSQEVDTQNKYNELITEADQLFQNKEYDAATIKYQNALKFKPEEEYPVNQLAEIKVLSSELEKLEDQYLRIVSEADILFTSKEYQEAKAKYIEASALFPEETHPKTRIEEINLIYKADNQNSQVEYDRMLAEADKFFASASYIKAIDSYRKASAIMPEESHPQEMIVKIEKILDDNAMRKIVNSSVTIKNNEEEKFTFEPLSDADRKSSVLIINAKGIASRNFKVFVNYGKGGSKNGGFILPITPGDKAEEYIISLGKQNKWFSEDNNWIKITPQGGSIDITVMKIAKE